jgi:D-amino-acid dehydrogenase
LTLNLSENAMAAPFPAPVKRVVVIGAGIVGIATASYLRRDGHQVTVIDRLPPGEGCSRGNAGSLSAGAVVPLSMPGMLRKVPRWLLDPLGPLYIDWRYLPFVLPWLLRFVRAGAPPRVEAIADALKALNAKLFEAYGTLVKEAGCADLIRRDGTLYLYEHRADYAKDTRSWDLRRARGIPFEELGADEIRQLEPSLAPIYETGILIPGHGHCLNPWRLVQELARHLANTGGTILQGEVTDLQPRPDGPSRVVTSLGPIEADAIVVAAGAWSARLARRIGHRVPLESERGYHVTIADPGAMPRLPLTSMSGKFMATPMETGLRIAGTVEFKGLDAPADMRRAEALLIHARRMFKDLKTERTTTWMGQRPSLPDSLPVIGPSPRHPAVLFAFGHAHLGLTGAATTGKAVADLVAGRTPDFDLAPFRVDRF